MNSISLPCLSVDLIAGNVIVACRNIPPAPWTVSKASGSSGAILDKSGNAVLISLDADAEIRQETLEAVTFIRSAAPILASRAARAVRVAQDCVEALEMIKGTSSLSDATEEARGALLRAANIGIKPKGAKPATDISGMSIPKYNTGSSS